jgi:putative membrane protein
MACAPVLFLLGAACRNDTSPSGSGPTPALPSTAPVQNAAPPSPQTEPMGTRHDAPPTPSISMAAPASAGTATGTNHGVVAELPGPLTDGQIAAITEGLNSGEIEQAKIAMTKSKNKDVLGFASMMIEHHGQAKKAQAALKETPETSPLALELQADAQKMLTGLNQAKGADFDRAYLDAQVQGHEKALATLRQKLLPSVKAPELARYLQGLQPKIEQHLARARTLRDALASNLSDRDIRGMTQPVTLKQDSTSARPPSHPTKP